MKKLFSIAFLFVFAFTAYGQTVKSITPQEQGTVALLMIERETVTGKEITLDTTYMPFIGQNIEESISKRTAYLDEVTVGLEQRRDAIQHELDLLKIKKSNKK